MTVEDHLIVDPRVVAGQLATPEQAQNYVLERIQAVYETIRRQPPPPTDQLTSVAYLRWERKLMLYHGQAIGTLMALQAFGHVPIPMFETLKRQLLSALLHRTAEAALGVQP
ncbi:MAG: hypothetical protein MUC88_00270 [Planctomycetes bacterium]|jgi:hypothetical protein|nr:hypothetical protein [Planctomycetota bacterium]